MELEKLKEKIINKVSEIDEGKFEEVIFSYFGEEYLFDLFKDSVYSTDDKEMLKDLLEILER